MTEKEFLDNWITVGTRHKQHTETSRTLERRVTGSKGVGRLSAPFLAERRPTPKAARERLHTFVDWETAIDTHSLTEAEALYWMEPTDPTLYPRSSPTGAYADLDAQSGYTAPSIKRAGS